MEFKPWPKITRVENKRVPIFTEKIDGTNACIAIDADGNYHCQSRNRIITPEDDNYGFARWCKQNEEAVLKLGEGYHFGEWWGQGIGRNYGLNYRRFSLFNTRRWGYHNPPPDPFEVVPVLPFDTIELVKEYLQNNGSVVVPGWMRPEGAVMYEPDTDTCFKIIMDK